jgi:hypothetical protein
MMQSKLVENWLTSAKELSFTAPFAQLLIAEGYTVIQSKGGVVEQGKDIIARDKNGIIHCFQLKCGNIGSNEWQSINGQLNDLTGIPPIHPSLATKTKKWVCHLVTNGDITGPVSRTISDYSDSNVSNERMALETISKDELLRRFSDAFGNFFPVEPNDVRIFFELYCEDGDNVLKRQEFKQYIERFLSTLDAVKSKQKKLEAIQAVPILVSYLLGNKYRQENNVALINAWILTLITILYYANSWLLDTKKYAATENIILDEIDKLCGLLMNDVANNDTDLVDTTYGVFSEPVISYRLRCAELLGYISAAMNYSILSGRTLPDVPASFIDKFAITIQKKMLVSESGIPYFYNSILASAMDQDNDIAAVELETLVDSILASHADNGEGLISPYYSTEEAVASLFGSGEPIEENFHNRSYMLWTAVLLLVKYNRRSFLDERWTAISEISMEEIVAYDQNDLLLWRTDKSDMMDSFPNSEQSWNELKDQASRSYDNEIPSVLLNRKYLIPLMVLAMPHRLTPKMMLSLVNQ